MLRIEKLFVQGFKSFCDPTEIVLAAEGITAVVGPNGCGKSNIADSLSWVIGEQRPKAMRGGKMEDVIFTGSRNRQPSGMAEVLLTMLVTETFEIRGEFSPPAASEPDETAQLQLPPAPEAVVAEAAESTAETPANETEDKTKKRRKTVPKSLAKVFQEGERITVGRRLYRTGESEYELNGRSCRLRDIQDLFAGTGLGGAHYAIIEQGRIGQVLSAKPLDRRALLEEAAGISKFKMRQHAAELKLEGARGNLARLADILAEVERQQASLKRQAAKARRYSRLRHELRDLLRAVYVVDYRTTHSALGSLEVKLSAIASRETQALSSITGFETEQSQASVSARTAEEALNETRERAAQLELESERARQQRNYLTENLQSLSERAAQFAHDQAVIGERNEVINQETARLRADLQRLDEEINAESKTLAAEEEQQQALLARDAEAEQRLEEARKKVYDATTQLERWRQLQRQFADAVERSETRLQGLAVERERAQTQAQAAEAAYDALTEQLDASADRQQAISEQLAAASAQLTEQRRHREARQTALTATQHELTATEHRLKSLRELDERHAYFSEAVQLLFNRPANANGANGFQLFGTLADFVHVAPEHEAMVETGLREELQYVVAPTYNDALKAIEFLKSTGGGRATFLVTGLHAGSPSSLGPSVGHEVHTNGHAGTLHSLLNLRPDLADAFQLALPGLAGAQIVEDLAQAIENTNGNGHAAVVLARTGERLSAGRLVTGGSRSETGKGVLALKREIAELTDHLTALTTANEASAAALGIIKTQVAELDDLRARLDSELRLVEKQSAVLREQFQQGERERQRIATLLRVVETETAQVESEHADFEGKLEHAADQTHAAQKALAEVQEVVAAAQNELAELRRRTDQRAQELSRRRAEFAAKTERRRGLQNDLRRLEHEANDLGNRLARLRMEAVAADEQNTILQTNLADTAQRLEQLAAQQAELAQELAACAAELSAARAQVEALEAQLRALREAATNAREERAQAEIEGARLTSNLEHIAASCYSELNERLTDVLDRLAKAANEAAAQPVTALAPLTADDNGEDDENDVVELSFWQVPEDFDLELAKARLDELRARIENLGPVNMMALQELTEVEERQIFLTTQKADIEKAVADTQAAIAEIKRRSRERFQDAFTAINENFKQMFQELFGGGHGEMRLIDESDILESGIEIIAQPPGKRLQNVLLLSGGEKAMAALALVLAIFRYRPSPFCLLDEVDAPLDEMNIGRFAEKVIEMSRNTQFLIITHSKRTMEIAQTLYGVTMEDPGVSKLISVRLS